METPLSLYYPEIPWDRLYQPPSVIVYEPVSQRWGLLRVIADAIGRLSSSTGRGRIMTAFQIIAIILSLTALGSYLNYRYLKLPASIGHLVQGLTFKPALKVLLPQGRPP